MDFIIHLFIKKLTFIKYYMLGSFKKLDLQNIMETEEERLCNLVKIT